jgi:hypothetical protein
MQFTFKYEYALNLINPWTKQTGKLFLILYDFEVLEYDRLCGLVVRVLGYRSGGPGSIPGITRKKKVVGLE